MVLRLVIRGSSRRWRQASSFGISGSFHALLLVWLVWAAATQQAEPSPTLYDLAVKPYEKHIVWYNLREKLPNIKPAEPGSASQSPRARVKFKQNIAAGKSDDSRTPQKILMPAPAIELPKPMPLPNMLAVTEQSRIRAFVPPVSASHPAAPAPVLPEAPQLAGGPKNKPVEVAISTKPPVRAFVPPAEKRAEKPPTAPVFLPDAPRLDASPSTKVTLPVAEAMGPRRAFSVPSTPVRPKAPEPAGPAAPELSPAAPLSASAPVIPHGFVPPPTQTRPAPAPQTQITAPPLLDATATPGATATLAVVGLDPARTMEVPPPPGSHEAGFSAGTKPEPPSRENPANASASITVPDLATRGGAIIDRATTVNSLAGPNARQSLLAALHEAIPASVMGPAPNPAPGATRVASAPDGRLSGRVVYMLAIQMPNVTSYSGSWIVWFAEHQPEPGETAGDLRPPVALRKVDPKYIQSAVDERVEGTVRLAAVIRKTGHVDSVELLQHLDPRLDRSAAEALAKWEFEPARHNGVPVDLDAVFEIPFRLAPKPKR